MRYALAALLALIPTAASAHIVFADPQADTGSYYAGFLRVSHGCGDAATVSVRVELPIEVLSARPQPKPGWTLAIDHAPLAKPVTGEGGAVITQRVAAITWTGALPADQFDQFGIMMKLPDRPGALYFPTTQRCTTGANVWTAIPPSPAQWHATKNPAPMLVLNAASTMDHSMH